MKNADIIFSCGKHVVYKEKYCDKYYLCLSSEIEEETGMPDGKPAQTAQELIKLLNVFMQINGICYLCSLFDETFRRKNKITPSDLKEQNKKIAEFIESLKDL